MSGIDKRNRLDEEPFAYQITKNSTVLISYEGKKIMIVKGKDAERLSAKLAAAEGDKKQVQLVLAKATGNFKHGNEKMGKNKMK